VPIFLNGTLRVVQMPHDLLLSERQTAFDAVQCHMFQLVTNCLAHQLAAATKTMGSTPVNSLGLAPYYDTHITIHSMYICI
jgi:hypothetical protein